MLLSMTSAIRYENNTLFYGTVNSSGLTTITTTPVTGASVFGSICGSANCATHAGTLWNGSLVTIPGSSIVLEYPTALQSPFGYGLYFVKAGHIPFEVGANWFGTDATDPQGPFPNYLTRKESCTAPLASLTATNTTSFTATASLASPLNDAGPLTSIPAQVAPFYATTVNVSLSVSNATFSLNQTFPFSLNSSETRTVTLPTTLPLGTYNLSVTSLTSDAKCLASVPTTLQQVLVINTATNTTNTTDTTPPASVSNLSLGAKNTTFILWTWTNPTDLDFATNIIYLNGINVVNTTNAFYNATGLQANIPNTIRINMRDAAGNINTFNITDTQTTLPGSSTNNTNGTIVPPTTNGGTEEKKKKKANNVLRESINAPLVEGLVVSDTAGTTLILIEQPAEERTNYGTLILLLLLLLLCILLASMIYLLLGKKR